MDIQEKQAFESNFRTTEIYRRECVIRGRDILEFSKTMNGYFNIIANEAWRLWQAAKAQAVPDGFLVVSSKELLDLTVAINAVDLATHTDNKTNEVREMWQDIAIKLLKLGKEQEQNHE